MNGGQFLDSQTRVGQRGSSPRVTKGVTPRPFAPDRIERMDTPSLTVGLLPDAPFDHDGSLWYLRILLYSVLRVTPRISAPRLRLLPVAVRIL